MSDAKKIEQVEAHIRQYYGVLKAWQRTSKDSSGNPHKCISLRAVGRRLGNSYFKDEVDLALLAVSEVSPEDVAKRRILHLRFQSMVKDLTAAHVSLELVNPFE